MKEIQKIGLKDKKEFYENLNLQLQGLVEDEPDWLANLANGAALLYMLMEDINWAGFYLHKNGELILGPFQGKPACTHIPLGKGVCGTAALGTESLVVPDVHEFSGHIACDSASNSEIVVPIRVGNKLMGVLDIDSPVKQRFDREDAAGLEKFVEVLKAFVDWEKAVRE